MVTGSTHPPDEKTTDEQIIVFGTVGGLDEVDLFQLGRFEISVANGQIASIHCDGAEIARGLSYLVRDENWATCEGTNALSSDASNRIVISGEVDENGIRFSYRLNVTLEPDGALLVTSKGEAFSSFKTNRIGLSILHPVPDVVGMPMDITHSDGHKSATTFPIPIQPAQPVFDIARMSYPLTRSSQVTISFKAVRADGKNDSFEMEDQRNWGDASYKTYIGSLRDPWPFAVQAGDILRQSIRIRVEDSNLPTPNVAEKPKPTFRLPPLGVSIPMGAAQEALRNITLYGGPKTAFVSAYFSTDAINTAELAAMRDIALSVPCPLRLELEVHGDPEIALSESAAILDKYGLAFSHILACPAAYLKSFQPDGEWPDYEPLATFYDRVRAAFPAAEIGGGMLTYFTELNRKWPPLRSIDFIGHGYCPIIHAADDKTILQNVATLPLMAETIARNATGLPYDLISAQLSMRSNPYGARPVHNMKSQRIAMADRDPREQGEFAGIWMLAVAEAMAVTQARSFCLGALAGPASLYDEAMPDGKRPSFTAFDALATSSGATKAEFDCLANDLRSNRFQLGSEHLGKLLL